VSWLKEEGDWVRRGDELCEIETDKAVTRLESAAEGVLLRTLVPPDTEVLEGSEIAWVGKPGEEIPQSQPDAVPATPSVTDSYKDTKRGEGPEASPLVRNLARKLKVDLKSVEGTGPGGRITKADVENYAAGQASS
jgi:pyruvate dehydrogenase E2 component (dihydrolipoamide acetyltransferase)